MTKELRVRLRQRRWPYPCWHRARNKFNSFACTDIPKELWNGLDNATEVVAVFQDKPSKHSYRVRGYDGMYLSSPFGYMETMGRINMYMSLLDVLKVAPKDRSGYSHLSVEIVK